ASRTFGGTSAYFASSLRALARIRRGRIRCTATLNGTKTDVQLAGYMVAVCNGRYFGSGMHVAPMAKVDDGRFEVVAMDAPNKVAFAVSSTRIYAGKHLRNDGTKHFACDSLELTLENEDARDVFLLDVDGEPLGKLPLRVTMIPSALTLRA